MKVTNHDSEGSLKLTNRQLRRFSVALSSLSLRFLGFSLRPVPDLHIDYERSKEHYNLMLQALIRKMVLVHIVTLLFLTLTFGKGDVIYPKKHENQELATRIYCQVQEPQHFHYSSITELWGMMGGQIILEADITVRCIGDDQGGKFESDALKYRVQINNLQLTEKKVSNKESMIRHKRGAGEFFSRSWDQIKQFFKRVFKRKGREPEPPKPKPTESTDERRETPAREDLPEDFVISDSMYSTPFQFVQFANGSIPEIRFSENEIDNRVKNFKRHLVDAFSTQLNSKEKHNSILEKSIMGEHTSTYDVKVNNPAESLTLAGFGMPVKVEEPTVVVKKLVTERDILKLAPSEALNDREKMNLKVEQMQIFQGGRMISSSGFSSLILLPGSELARNRVRRDAEHDDEEDITSHLQTHSTFDIQLQVRERRSTRYSTELESDDTEYVTASRMAEQEVDSKTLKFAIQEKTTMDATAIFEHLLKGNHTEYDEIMQIIFETVEREVSMKKDKENGSVSSTLKKIFSREVMQEFCTTNFSLCKDFLQLLALAGGSEAENVSKTKCSVILKTSKRLSLITLK
ncbi:hypothetical protein JTE90_000163 [Oedothorax gibbosus]|uniref:Vitellogenin domain-containing protein n=1 Tax=Oedothorax gibbosus TaxID=931172 RepID=A0AAV6UV60_9ARAC|nr:hypothetical protein JTE90_000163 [Oedothorax gibbosus]